jgi:hypothetical protein
MLPQKNRFRREFDHSAREKKLTHAVQHKFYYPHFISIFEDDMLLVFPTSFNTFLYNRTHFDKETYRGYIHTVCTDCVYMYAPLSAGFPLVYILNKKRGVICFIH